MKRRAIAWFAFLVALVINTICEAQLVDAGRKTFFQFGKVTQGIEASEQFTITNLSSLERVAFTITTSPPFAAKPAQGGLLPKQRIPISITILSQTLGTVTKPLEIRVVRGSETQTITGWTLEATVTPNQPDLVVFTVTVVDVTREGSPPRTELAIDIQFRNLGTKPTSAFQYTVSLDSKVEFSDRVSGPIAAGGFFTALAGFETTKTGPGHVITVEADSNHEIEELNEGNNTSNPLNKDFP
jgi:hypothetical protein